MAEKRWFTVDGDFVIERKDCEISTRINNLERNPHLWVAEVEKNDIVEYDEHGDPWFELDYSGRGYVVKLVDRFLVYTSKYKYVGEEQSVEEATDLLLAYLNFSQTTS